MNWPALIPFFLKGIEWVMAALPKYKEARRRAKFTREQIQRMIDEGRGPTPEEIDEQDEAILRNANERDRILGVNQPLPPPA